MQKLSTEKTQMVKMEGVSREFAENIALELMRRDFNVDLKRHNCSQLYDLTATYSPSKPFPSQYVQSESGDSPRDAAPSNPPKAK